MFKPIRLFSILFLLTTACAAGTPKIRPCTWAQPVIGSSLRNFYRVSDEFYRSEQPKASDIRDLKELGIRTIVSLRHYHPDSREFARAGVAEIQYKMDAGSVSSSDLIAVLRIIRSAKKPVLLHCWHGSDRTGFIAAGYRIVMMGWSADKAIQELRLGGYGYHERYYPNITTALRELDVTSVRNAVFGRTPHRPLNPEFLNSRHQTESGAGHM